jgi:hypothetical protein
VRGLPGEPLLAFVGPAALATADTARRLVLTGFCGSDRNASITTRRSLGCIASWAVVTAPSRRGRCRLCRGEQGSVRQGAAEGVVGRFRRRRNRRWRSRCRRIGRG